MRQDTPSAGEAQHAIATRALSLSYGQTHVLRGIDLGLNRGQTLALLGPSGCGKTTLLRLVAGLLAPTRGDIFIDGRQVAGQGVLVPPERRGLGMVFQDYALWPHLSVAGNVAFPLEMAGVGRAERDRRVMAALSRVGLAEMSARRPSALSGGQQQRVAIARAIVGEPRIVLFDEPLSNLDRELRETMVAELGALIRDLGLTAIYVTHDQSEALTLADRVAVMDAGEIAQLAAPEDLVEHPASPKVAEFLRLGAVLTLRRVAEDWHLGQHPLGLTGGPASAMAHVLVTPRALVVADAAGATLTGDVIAIQYRDTAYAITVRLADTAPVQTVQIASNTRMRIGDRIGLTLLSDRLRWFPAQSPHPLKETRSC
ncbi:ABC transporter ATP-binding protein [Roseicyclus mahoneyensis]|uniref:Iron(III) transport system ATP-binding protein n=1 Tax=Roseicyclus mahoneyensis TaxID=164332 RepID=A0A316GHX9_9RHOB|nr:ABC transporter ATP-binding protein [Roseicyclus mahoneyensis]PWK59598.1 iron(III) transport system ATP-binding protein [Roseicyclus mahoneyensis]